MNRSRGLAVWVVLLGLTACEPLIMLPGGRLSGEVSPPPATWGFTDDIQVVQLETRPDEPYSVNIAYTQLDGALYVNAGDTETRWVQHMESNPLVRLRISGELYELRAERVTDPAEIAGFGEAWVSHSMLHRDPTKLEEVWLYRLLPR